MAKFPKSRERRTGRSVYGDFMDDDVNESVYDTLIEASEKIQTVLNILREYTGRLDDGGQSAFEIGVLTAARLVVEECIDDDYPPLQAVRERRASERLLWAVSKR